MVTGLSHLIANKRIELFAALLNMAAGGSFAAGIATPVAASLFYHAIRPAAVIVGTLIFLSFVAILHSMAQYALGSLHDG